jgi:dienelactone hydrolase
MKKTMKSLRRERAGLWAGFWGFVFCIVALGRLVAADTRGIFLKLIDRPRVAADAVVTTRPSADGLTEYHFTFASDAQQRVPGFLIEKSDGPAVRRPVVIALHGTGGTKSDELPLLRILANRGFIAVAIDGRYHGERVKSGNGAGRGSAEYQDAILRTFRGGGEHPFYFDTVWDVMRLIDYLQTRDDVDPARIGLYGVSKGGIETYLSAAVDPRIDVAVPCIGLESFKWALDNNDWQGRIGTIPDAFAVAARDSGIATPTSDFVHEFYNRVAPGIDGEFDGPQMVKLIAPRPLMAINSDTDPHTPLPGVQLCVDAAHAAYTDAGASDHFVIRIQPKTGHKVNPDSQAAAVDWFVQWLKP